MFGLGGLARMVTKIVDKLRGRKKSKKEATKPKEVPAQVEDKVKLSAGNSGAASVETRGTPVAQPPPKLDIPAKAEEPAPVEEKKPVAQTEQAPKPENNGSSPTQAAKEPETKPEPEKPATPEPASNHEDLLKSAVERLSEDEALRGDLSDVGFGPLLDWAIAAAQAYSSKAPDAAAMENYTDKLRNLVEAAVNVAQNGKLDDPSELLDFETGKKEKLAADLKALELGDDADANAEQLAKILQDAL